MQTQLTGIQSVRLPSVMPGNQSPTSMYRKSVAQNMALIGGRFNPTTVARTDNYLTPLAVTLAEHFDKINRGLATEMSVQMQMAMIPRVIDTIESLKTFSAMFDNVNPPQDAAKAQPMQQMPQPMPQVEVDAVKVDAKADAKPEAKADAKPEAVKVDAKAEAKVDAKPEDEAKELVKQSLMKTFEIQARPPVRSVEPLRAIMDEQATEARAVAASAKKPEQPKQQATVAKPLYVDFVKTTEVKPTEVKEACADLRASSPSGESAVFVTQEHRSTKQERQANKHMQLVAYLQAKWRGLYEEGITSDTVLDTYFKCADINAPCIQSDKAMLRCLSTTKSKFDEILQDVAAWETNVLDTFAMNMWFIDVVENHGGQSMYVMRPVAQHSYFDGDRTSFVTGWIVLKQDDALEMLTDVYKGVTEEILGDYLYVCAPVPKSGAMPKNPVVIVYDQWAVPSVIMLVHDRRVDKKVWQRVSVDYAAAEHLRTAPKLRR